MIGAALRQPITLVIGLALGVLAGMATIPIYTWGMERYDATFHVLNLKAEVVALNADQITIHATGEKVRDCQYVRLQAYTVHNGGVLHDAQIMRVDQYEDRDIKPVGRFDFGFWRIWPRDDAISVQVFSQYLCSGRMVVAKVIELKVPK